jgi:hypothetical protein
MLESAVEQAGPDGVLLAPGAVPPGTPPAGTPPGGIGGGTATGAPKARLVITALMIINSTNADVHILARRFEFDGFELIFNVRNDIGSMFV